MKVHCLNKISKVGLAALPKAYELCEDINDADLLLVRSAKMHEIKLSKKVLAIGRAGAGVNNIPLDVYAKEGVVVFNTPGANANAVKELSIAAMLLAARDIRGGMNWVIANKDDVEINKTMEKAKSAFAGSEISGKTLGIFGLGAIGSLIANAAGALGMKVVGYELSSAVIAKNKELFPDDIELVSSPDELYKKADYISLNVPLVPATKGMLNKEAFSKMKDGVIIINIARDAIVNDEDLKAAIAEGKVRKYVTDFPNHTTANMDNVVALPHLGASTEEAEDNCALMAVKELVDFVENGNIINSVNYPRLDLGKKKGVRLIALYENKDGIAEQLHKVVMKETSILKMENATKGDYGASLLELSSAIDIDGIEIDGMIRLRLI